MGGRACEGSYRALLAIPGLGRAVGSALLARTAAQVQAIVLVLFVLERYHSATLAGLTVTLALLPGLLASPVACVLLDRAASVKLMSLDYLAGASALVLRHMHGGAATVGKGDVELEVAYCVGGVSAPLWGVPWSPTPWRRLPRGSRARRRLRRDPVPDGAPQTPAQVPGGVASQAPANSTSFVDAQLARLKRRAPSA